MKCVSRGRTQRAVSRHRRVWAFLDGDGWNSLPEHIRAEPYIGVFRKRLKTLLFNLAFNVHWHSGFLYVTVGMHLCSACNRCTTDALDDDDDDDDDAQSPCMWGIGIPRISEWRGLNHGTSGRSPPSPQSWRTFANSRIEVFASSFERCRNCTELPPSTKSLRSKFEQTRFRKNVVYCVAWGVKLYSLTPKKWRVIRATGWFP